MTVKYFTNILKDTSQRKFLPLLVTTLLFLGGLPLIDRFVRLRFLLDVLFSLIVLTAIYAVSQKRRYALIALVIAVPMLVMTWVDKFVVTDRLLIGSQLMGGAFFGYAIFRLVAFIFTESRVTRNVIYAAIIVYLFMGLLWSEVYQLLNYLQPGSFDISGLQTVNPARVLTYYSYVTLTTLGYGDISPLTDLGYSLAVLEAIVGQLYLAVLVARLVGLHIAHSGGREKEGPL